MDGNFRIGRNICIWDKTVIEGIVGSATSNPCLSGFSFFLLILFAVNISVMAVSVADIDWKDPEEYTLDWDEEVNVSGYTIKLNK